LKLGPEFAILHFIFLKSASYEWLKFSLVNKNFSYIMSMVKSNYSYKSCVKLLKVFACLLNALQGLLVWLSCYLNIWQLSSLSSSTSLER